MAYTLQEKYDKIKAHLMASTATDPILLMRELMAEDFVDMHGPEHHFLDGATLLAAYRNAGGVLKLGASLRKLAALIEGMDACNDCAVCGAVASVEAALSLIRKSDPAANGREYRQHISYTSRAISELGRYGGPRCCKRNGFLAILLGVRFLAETYGINLTATVSSCDFAPYNKQCLGALCPFFGGSKAMKDAGY